ncbi:MAG: class I SAM-dependent methyltransferase [Saprospiraceae bacterium]|nr:class I SAM-dependent methyltransferase [Saprospiraceae bacterium]
MTNWPPEHCIICGEKDQSEYLTVRDHSISGEDFHIARCKNCGFSSTKDAPSQEKIGKYYESEDYISHSDTTKGLIDRAYHWARSFMLRKKKNWVESQCQEKGELLDIGSGTGYFLNEMKKSGWDVTGIEINEKARRFSQEEFDVRVYEPDQLHEFTERSFDVISLWHVLEHVHEINAYWDLFSRLLKEDGVLMIAVPNIQSIDSKYYGAYWAALDVPRHLWHFRPEDIVRLAKNHGFQLKNMTGMPLDALYVSILSEKYKQHPSAFVRGVGIGLWSNLRARGAAQMSSVVYVLKKMESS